MISEFEIGCSITYYFSVSTYASSTSLPVVSSPDIAYLAYLSSKDSLELESLLLSSKGSITDGEMSSTFVFESLGLNSSRLNAPVTRDGEFSDCPMFFLRLGIECMYP